MITLTWNGDLRFTAVTERGATLKLDSKGSDGPSPMDSLLASLCGCMGIDVVDILTKMRQPPEGFEVEASAERNSEPPKYFTKLNLLFRIKGGVASDKAERAVRLSFDTYCSVFHTLRPDLEVTHRIELD